MRYGGQSAFYCVANLLSYISLKYHLDLSNLTKIQQKLKGVEWHSGNVSGHINEVNSTSGPVITAMGDHLWQAS